MLGPHLMLHSQLSIGRQGALACGQRLLLRADVDKLRQDGEHRMPAVGRKPDLCREHVRECAAVAVGKHQRVFVQWPLRMAGDQVGERGGGLPR